MIVFSIVVVDSSWLVSLIRSFIKLLRQAEPEAIQADAEFHIGEDKGE